MAARENRNAIEVTATARDGASQNVIGQMNANNVNIGTRDRPDLPEEDAPASIEHWQGRETERQQLAEWIADPTVKLVEIVGVGGIGKSTLAAKLYEAAKVQFWVDLGRSNANFASVARRVLRQVGNYYVAQVETIPEIALANSLARLLCDRECLLVLDNLESALATERDWQDRAWRDFFGLWLQNGQTSTILVTTREIPELPSAPTVKRLELTDGLAPEEGETLLRSLGVRGETEELQQFSETVRGFPLSVWLVAGFLCTEEADDPQLCYLEQHGYDVRSLHRGRTISTWEILDWSWGRLQLQTQQLLQLASV